MFTNKINYNKKPLTIDEQISLLENRGLIINNKNYAEELLSQISYYRLSAYTIVFEVDETGEERIKERKHLFKCGTTFESIINLYNYDTELRGNLLKAILEIEVFIKTLIAYELSTKLNDPFILYDKKTIEIGNSKKAEINNNKHHEIIENLNSSCNFQQEIFIKHYNSRYSNAPKMPIWLATEVMTIGDIAKYYSVLKKDYQKHVSKKLNINDPVILSQWLYTINYLRNRAAHNHRIFNKRSKFPPNLTIVEGVIIRDKQSDYNNEILKSIEDSKLKECIYSSVIMLEYIIHNARLNTTHIKNIYNILAKLVECYPQFKESIGIDENMTDIKPIFIKN